MRFITSEADATVGHFLKLSLKAHRIDKVNQSDAISSPVSGPFRTVPKTDVLGLVPKIVAFL